MEVIDYNVCFLELMYVGSLYLEGEQGNFSSERMASPFG